MFDHDSRRSCDRPFLSAELGDCRVQEDSITDHTRWKRKVKMEKNEE
jgi:hypothetical protein